MQNFVEGQKLDTNQKRRNTRGMLNTTSQNISRAKEDP